MKRKRIIACIAAAVIIITSVFAGITAFGNDINWRYDAETDTLYISGTGETDNYSDGYNTPWSLYVDSVKKLVVEDGVMAVGDNVLSGAPLLEEVELAASVSKIGYSSFASCPSLLTIEFGDNISFIADESFARVGITEKAGFCVICNIGSYALSFAIRNGIPYSTSDVKCGKYDVSLYKSMTAYYPYTPVTGGTYRFYSVSRHDTEGAVYNSELTRVAYNDDHSSENAFNSSMSSVDFGLTVNLTAGNTYYFTTNITNPSLTANYEVYIEPVSFTVTGRIYAVKNKKGELSDMLLSNATMNGEATNGQYTYTYSVQNPTAEFSCDGATLTHTFNPDDTSQDIGIMLCDANNDGVVNGKDYRLLKKNNSPYIQFFSKLAGYKK